MENKDRARERNTKRDKEKRSMAYKVHTDCDMIWKRARNMVPDEEKKEQALMNIRQTVERKTVFRVPSYGEMFLVELQYISPAFWALQGIFLAVLVFLLEGTAVEKGILTDHLQWSAGNGETLTSYLQWTSIIAAWMGVAGCSQLGRHFSKGMAELEQSCYFNLAQMWAIRMALTGIVDLVILTLCSGRIAERTNAPFAAVCLYVLVPFVLSNVCCMLFFTALRGGRGRYVQLVLAFVTGTFSAVPSVTPVEAYARTSLWVWAAALAGGIGIYLWQLKCMYGKIKRGDVVCWN